ncbi:uncharacterized protein LOC129905224 [Episyrphus balteatus]|uniref:uncharacterized protein LOC129905224 n=1 Tax=Episyrphus balteatus TaxID=286459 RepID=UPI002484E016|nr:uncharacterized protein LOC129905224 [Episyrphus balteatus]
MLLSKTRIPKKPTRRSYSMLELQRQCRLPPKRNACTHCGNRNIAQQQVSDTTNTHPQLDSHSGNFEGQKLVSGIDGPRTTIQVSQTKRDNKSLTVEATINNKQHVAIIDTGATASIVRRDLVKMTWLHNTNSYRLKTATGEAARVYGEVRLTIRRAELEFSHVFLVADICDECIIGIDFMKDHGIILDIGNQVLKYRNVEIPMVYGNENSTTIRTFIKEDMCLPPSSEVFVWTKLKGNIGSHRYLMVEPEVEQSSQNVIIGKTLVAPKNNMVPVRILNIKPYPIKLKKGEVVGQCESVPAITKINEADTQMTMNSEKLKTQILKSDNLSQHQLNVAGRLLHEYADIFSSPSGQYGRTQLVQHRIDTGDARPIRQPARRLPLAKQGEVEAVA